MTTPPSPSKRAGPELPEIGLGTARLGSGETLRRAIRGAIVDAGIRAIDCAKVYGNERAVGRELRMLIDEGVVQREELFITSKLWNDDHSDPRKALLRSLEALGLDYLDLYLIHWPMAWRKGTIMVPDSRISSSMLETWARMESLIEEGLTRHVGVSNFDRTRLEEILANCRVKPYCNQIELHPRNSQPKLVAFCLAQGIRVVAWSPLAKGARWLADDPVVRQVALETGLTPAQVVIRWHLDRGVIVLPRSTSKTHLCENAAAQRAPRLCQEHTQAVDSIDRGARLVPDLLGLFDDTPARKIRQALRWFLELVARLVFAVVPNTIDLAQGQSSPP